MKILMVLPDLSRGGAQNVFIKLANELSKDNEVSLCVLTNEDLSLKSSLSSNVSLTIIDSSRVLFSVKSLYKTIRKLNPKTVFSTLGYVNIVVGLLSFFFPDVKFVGREGNILSLKLHEAKYPELLIYFYKLSYRGFSKIIMQSKDMKKDFLIYFPQFKEKIFTIPNPIEISQEQKKESHRVIAMGKLHPQKGFDLLIETYSQIRNPRPLDIYGEGEERRKLEELINEKKMDDIIHLKGLTSFPLKELASAKFFILSSRYEGFPNVVLEALSVGTPVIANKCPGGINEIFESGKGIGKVVDIENSIELEDALEQEYLRKDEIQEYIKQKYSIHKIVSEYKRVLS